MKTKDFLIVALAPVPVMLIPLVAMRFTSEVNWSAGDFVFAWFVIAGATFVYRLLATRKSATITYRVAAGVAVVTGFLMTWITAAVAIIGHGNPANILYVGVLLVGLTGVGLARFQTLGLARTAFAAAGATFLVPVIAIIFWPSDFSPGVPQVFMLNGIFVVMFAGSGLLFRHAAGQRPAAGEPETA